MRMLLRETRRHGDAATRRNSPCLPLSPSPRLSARGYTIIEVLIAAGLLVIGLAAAVSMANTMLSQEEGNARVARALNLQEQAARLYQLGLEPSEILVLLPDESNVDSLTFTTNTNDVGGVALVETANCKLVFNAGESLISGNTAQSRTNTLVVVRPSIR